MRDEIAERVQLAVDAALDKKAFELDVLSVSKVTSIADYFIICSGNTDRQTRAIADAVENSLAQRRVKAKLTEGTSAGRWILLDYGDFIMHIFTDECRRFYGLERLWGDAPNVTSHFLPQAAKANAGKK